MIVINNLCVSYVYPEKKVIHLCQIGLSEAPAWIEDCKTGFRMGLDEGQGMLVQPKIYRKIKDIDGAGFTADYQQVKNSHPELAVRLDNTANSFYMSYIHDPSKLAEFIAMAALIDGDQETLILTNQDSSFLEAPESKALLVDARISKIEYTDLKVPAPNGNSMIERSFNDEPRLDKIVRVIRLPRILNHEQYLSLFFYSKPVVGVTGNSTLFHAIAMGKLPFYAQNLEIQSEVNQQLADLDKTGKLKPFFNNKASPLIKADVFRKYSEEISSWAKWIVENRSLSQVVVKKML